MQPATEINLFTAVVLGSKVKLDFHRAMELNRDRFLNRRGLSHPTAQHLPRPLAASEGLGHKGPRDEEMAAGCKLSPAVIVRVLLTLLPSCTKLGK